jgi:hypothetical protein
MMSSNLQGVVAMCDPDAAGNAALSSFTDADATVSDDGLDAQVRAPDAVVAAFRHDVHKLRGRRHAAAHDEVYGVPVNESVLLGADRDAAVLSRPGGEPDEAVPNHVSPFRLSLLTGEAAVETPRIEAATNGGFRELVEPTDPETLHARWLTSPVPGGFNESVYVPYTSLKYHTLLVAALLDNYQAGHDFGDLYLAVSPVEESGEVTAATVLASDVVVPCRTVLYTPEFAVHVTAEPGDRPAAKLGVEPSQGFADAWTRLPALPIDVDGDRSWRVLDAQLRRINAWSTALQFIEEYVAWTETRSTRGASVGEGGGMDA